MSLTTCRDARGVCLGLILHRRKERFLLQHPRNEHPLNDKFLSQILSGHGACVTISSLFSSLSPAGACVLYTYYRTVMSVAGKEEEEAITMAY